MKYFTFVAAPFNKLPYFYIVSTLKLNFFVIFIYFILFYLILPACEMSKHGSRIIRKGNVILHVSVCVVFQQSSLLQLKLYKIDLSIP